MTYRAIPSPTRRFSRVVRVIAAADLAISAAIAVPFTAAAVVDYLFRLDLLLGFGTPAAVLLPSLILPINIAGGMGIVWAIARLGSQTLPLARLDTWRRFVVAGLVIYYVLLRGQTPVLVIFVLTELLAAVVQGLSSRRFARTTGA